VRCCKKHWDWIGNPDDTKKHPTSPRFVEDYNRSSLAKIGYWGDEDMLAQPPIMLNDDDVRDGAENCN
jgi:hypothetical protein